MNNEESTRMEEAQAETPGEETTPDEVAAPVEEPTANVEKELAVAQKQARDYFEGWQRERADFMNYKKRVEREAKDIQQNATSATLMSLLPVMDDFERAMSSLPADLNGHPWLEGVAAIQRKFQKILDDYGIVVIDPVGEEFDPSCHEALGTDSDTDIPVGHVTVTLQKGYASGERVLRPALVRVAG